MHAVNSVYENTQDLVNAAIYHTPDVVRQYSVRGLDIVESAALLKYQPSFAQQALLDIGIGTGRTTQILVSMVNRYIGIDYSPAMVQYVQRMQPSIDVRQMDMRSLRPLEDESFDFVFATNRVIDAVSHDDRLLVLSEVRRVLRRDGVFAFSSHNRSASDEVAHSKPILERSRNPFVQWRYWRQFRMQQKNSRELQRHFKSEVDYAIHNDIGHDFSLLHYYVDRPAQQQQLETAGFSLLDVFDHTGKNLRDNELGSNSASLLYVAKRHP